MYTRCVRIVGLIRFFNYPDFLEALAKVATLSTPVEYFVHETHHLLSVDLQVDVWGNNKGTVDDLCNKFLGTVARYPTSSGIFMGCLDYQASIDMWVQCERRALGLYPFGK